MTVDGSATSITVQWGMVPCIHQNGDITGYSVRYGIVGSGNTTLNNATGTGITIDGLQTSTNYTVEVAAINSAGIGNL